MNFFRKNIYDVFLSNDDWWSVWIGLTFCLISIFSSALFFVLKRSVLSVILPSIWNFTNITTMYTVEEITGQLVMMVLNFLFIIISFYSINFDKKTLYSDTLKYCLGFILLQLISFFIFIISNYEIFNLYGLKEELFAIIIGIILGNVIISFDKENIIKQSLVLSCKNAEYYIKIGLVLLAIDFIDYGKLLLPSILLSWPALLIEVCIIYFFGSLISENKSILIMMAVGVSICGASAATCIKETIQGKQTDLALVIAVISIFTIIQMISIPYIAKNLNVTMEIGAAWIGGTIDSTGSVVAAAGLFGGQEAIIIASTVKMIQNSTIGFVAVIILIAWFYKEENTLLLEKEYEDNNCEKIKRYLLIIIKKFPKFVLGFFIISILVTILGIFIPSIMLSSLKNLLSSVSKFWFTLGFLAIGFNTNYAMFEKDKEETNFKNKVFTCIILYIFGQMIDLTLKYGTTYMVRSLLQINKN